MLLDNINFAETDRQTYPMAKLKIIFTGRMFERKPLQSDLNEKTEMCDDNVMNKYHKNLRCFAKAHNCFISNTPHPRA